MGEIINAYILPHPPIIIPQIGRGEEDDASRTIEAFKRAARDIKKDNPDTIIIITPHGPFFRDLIYITDTVGDIEGDFRKFGAPKVKFKLENNDALVKRIKNNASHENIRVEGLNNPLIRRMGIPEGLDHGAMVPLYFINKELPKFKIVHISVADMPYKKLYKFGECVARSIDGVNEKIVVIASSDLSHSLTPDAPCGYNERGKIFDRLLVEYLKRGDIENIINFNRDIVEGAAECGLRPIIIMLGTLGKYNIHPDIYSYEGPYGVGYMVSKINPGRNPYISLAKRALETYVKESRIIRPQEGIPPYMLEHKGGVFVTIKKEGSLRGCIGTIYPVRENIAEEIIYNAISAGTEDPRFPAMKKDELGFLVYSVDIMKEPETVESLQDLDVQKYGVIVRTENKSGLLLPNLEGIDTPEKQVAIALQKAGIGPWEEYTMERFEVTRHRME